ncbi:hypothetical protein [Slackia heliotrinireducens]|uniref:hypothetical protein n=1 Tax=Slackia heliotrinireducens TaxID=84110 RepID=UPI003314BECA
MGILGSFLAAKSGSNAGDHFDVFYRRTFGEPMSAEAKQAISSAVTVIQSHIGTGRRGEQYGAEMLSDCIDSYVRAVGSNEDKRSSGIMYLMGICTNSNNQVLRGYDWAAQVIMLKAALYCPSLF